MTRLEEYVYRKHFHLSKAQMMEEPLEDVEINLTIMRLQGKKSDYDNKVLEAKAKNGVR
jgi:hypothetical protein